MKSSLKNMVLVLTLIAVVMGALLAIVHDITSQPIALAEVKAKNEALAAVLPAYDNDPTAQPLITTLPDDVQPVTIYTAKLGDSTSGYAVESYTLDGFSGEIKVMIGFDSNGVISGYKVLSHAETPGLGAKADDWFRDTTGDRSIIGTDKPLSLKKDNGSIDGITAATISSKAFLDAVNRARRAIETTNM